MGFAIVLTLLLLLADCASHPTKEAGTAPAPRIVVGDTLGGCGKLVKHVKPLYRPKAKGERLQEPVQLRAVVTRTGEMRDFELMKGDPLLAPAAIEAAKQWRYAPCIFNGEAIEVITSVEVSFDIRRR